MKNDFIEINNNSLIKCTLSSYGVGIRRLFFDNQDIITIPEKDEDYFHSDMFFGKSVGRISGRIKNSFHLNNFDYNLNEDEKGISLHGGRLNSLSFKTFDYEIQEDNKQKEIIFSYLSKNNENGFNGNIKIEIRYVFLLGKDEFSIIYNAKSDEDTILGFTNHTYFNLGNLDINNHNLYVNASKIATFSPNSLLINGSRDINKNEKFDFNSYPKLKDKLDLIEVENNALDNYFIFNKSDDKKVSLKNNDIILDIYTSYEGINIYVDSTKRKLNLNKRELNNSIRRGIALECAKNNFPIENLILKKNEKYSYYITYKLRRNNEL